MRANRGNFDILDALANSDRDADFDARIDGLMHRSAVGRRHTCSLGVLAIESTFGPYTHVLGETFDDSA